jgi:hypothetical protein
LEEPKWLLNSMEESNYVDDTLSLHIQTATDQRVSLLFGTFMLIVMEISLKEERGKIGI